MQTIFICIFHYVGKCNNALYFIYKLIYIYNSTIIYITRDALSEVQVHLKVLMLLR